MNRKSYPSVPLFAAVAALLALATVLVLSAPAVAAGPPEITGPVSPGGSVPPALEGKVGEMPSDGAVGLNASAFRASNRTGLGLPSYKLLLGKGWKQKAKKADKRFATELDESEAVPGAGKQRGDGVTEDEFDREFKIKDAIKGKGGKQTRSLRVAATLEGGCPLMHEGSEGYGWTGSGRAVYEVTTTERVGKYDLVTAVVMDGSFHARPDMLMSAEAEEFSIADYGEISITRNQVAVNRKTGKRSKVGETERYTSSIDPFYKPEGNFEAFIASQEDGAPAPERPLKTTDYTKLGGWFMLIPYDAMRSRVLEAAKLAQTPNKCVTISFPAAPTHLAPGQAVNLTGVPKLTADPGITPFFILQATSRIRADWINFQGQEATPLGKIHQLLNSKPWYSFKAPAKAWPETKPVGLDFTLYSAAGVAKAPVSFKPESPEVHYEILDASFSTDTDASRTTPLCDVGGHEQFDGTFHPTEFSPRRRARRRGQRVHQRRGRRPDRRDLARPSRLRLRHAARGGQPLLREVVRGDLAAAGRDRADLDRLRQRRRSEHGQALVVDEGPGGRLHRRRRRRVQRSRLGSLREPGQRPDDPAGEAAADGTDPADARRLRPHRQARRLRAGVDRLHVGVQAHDPAGRRGGQPAVGMGPRRSRPVRTPRRRTCPGSGRCGRPRPCRGPRPRRSPRR